MTEEAVGEETGGRGGLDEDAVPDRRGRKFAACPAFARLRDHDVRRTGVGDVD